MNKETKEKLETAALSVLGNTAVYAVVLHLLSVI
jgi:hypothetical protein